MSEWKPTWKPVTDEEILAQFAAAEQAAAEHDARGLVALAARYDRKADRIIIELKNGTAFMFPPHIAQGLAQASGDELSNIEISPAGWSLNWPSLDVGFTVEGLLAGVFGGKSWMARLRTEYARQGGRATSEAKRAAARENGKKGGRPKRTAL